MTIESRLGYTFTQPQLLALALTHSSCRKPCNEQLEFLGDTVLNLVIAERVLSANWAAPEGKLAAGKAQLVSNNNLYRIALTIDLGSYLYLGRSEECSGGRAKRNLLADAMEALIAAVYLDGGIHAAKAVVDRLVN